MLGADVLDAEVVDDESEGDGPSGVAEETRSVGGGGVAVLCEVLLEAVVGEDAGLGKAVHSLRISTTTLSSWMRPARWYCSMMFVGMYFTGIHMYSYFSI